MFQMKKKVLINDDEFSVRLDKVFAANAVSHVDVSPEAQLVPDDLLADAALVTLGLLVKPLRVVDSVAPGGEQFVAEVTPAPAIWQLYQVNISAGRCWKEDGGILSAPDALAVLEVILFSFESFQTGQKSL